MPVNQLRRRLGRHIQEAREAAGLSVERAAELVGVDQSVQRKIEKGKSGVSAERLALYASLFGVSASWLIGEESCARA